MAPHALIDGQKEGRSHLIEMTADIFKELEIKIDEPLLQTYNLVVNAQKGYRV